MSVLIFRLEFSRMIATTHDCHPGSVVCFHKQRGRDHLNVRQVYRQRNTLSYLQPHCQAGPASSLRCVRDDNLEVAAFAFLFLYLISFVFRFRIKWDVRGMFRLSCKRAIIICFRAVSKLRPASLSDRKVPAATPFRTTGRATQSRGKQLAIGHPTPLTLPSIVQ